MRFMILVKADADTEAGAMPTDDTLMAEMAAYHGELLRAGVLLDGAGLKPSRHGWRMGYDGARRTVTDGPFTEAKELIAGYTLIQTATREEALEWTRRFPNPSLHGTPCHIEVRELYELDDFPDNAPREQMREMGLGA
ncbi:YciI family protein [Caballeronia zhejiangensis]|uniref:Dehydrogenase n=1 Tax=Caballeronia zhejiangensis TaxID=871203 RepID=A0A656Q8L8_9BURK|nr:YciI family protein [Caballeronia zhejiangensis]KAK42488.1 dehydrogenase [Caballeronia jiangsuensis]KDR24583.1 dehydrogenase [Caballeronia zhejiangensis]